MTTEEQDAFVGRVIRESRAAEEKLNLLVTKLSNIGRDVQRLGKDIEERVTRATRVGLDAYTVNAGDFTGKSGRTSKVQDAGFEVGYLSNFADAVNLEALGDLDRQVSEAVANVTRLREQRKVLGV